MQWWIEKLNIDYGEKWNITRRLLKTLENGRFLS